MAITLRGNKSQALTHAELDGNFTDLDTRIITNASNHTTLDGIAVKTVNGQSPSSGAVTINTSHITENTNLYFTNARADARIAAASIRDVNDVDYVGTPTTNHVLTWDGDSWISAAPPGLGGGESNNGNNLGASGASVFSSKVGSDLQFRKIIGTAPITATQNTNDITIAFAPSADVSMGSNKLTSVTDPGSAQDAATKNYVDTTTTANPIYVAVAGDAMTGALAMGSNKITGLDTPTNGTDAATKAYADTMLPLAGGTMSGPIAMGTNKITGMGDPGAAQDAATKAYVDSQISGLNADKIIEGNSQVEVIDTGTGSVVITVDGTVEQTITASSTTFAGTVIIPDNGNIGSASDTDAIAISATGDVTLSQDLVVTGNLTINGTTTTLNTSTLTVDDALIGLQNGLGASANTNDLGFIMERGTSGSNAAFIFDESTDKFVIGTTTNTAADTGNITMDISGAGASTLQLHTLEATSVAGTLSTAAQTNITSVGTLTSLTSSGTIDADTFTTDGLTIVDNNITTTASNANILLNPNGTGKVQVLGNISATEFQGIATSAQYADLAEIYSADREYPPGTVVTVGGDAEITKAGPDTDYLAGVISTAPAYLMNSAADGEAVALVGRVPVRVVGNITKGMPVFATNNGCASSNGQGPLVGIALETNSDLGEKSVECLLKV